MNCLQKYQGTGFNSVTKFSGSVWDSKSDSFNLAAKYLKIQFTRVQGQVYYTAIPCFNIKTKLRHLKSIQMIYTVFLNCKRLVWGLNKYQNKLCASRIHLYVIDVIYVTCATTPYRIMYVLLIIFIKSIYILSIMFLIDNLINISKLQITCFYHTYCKNYRRLNTMTPNKMLIEERTFSLWK